MPEALNQWIERFTALHAKFKADGLGGDERQQYLECRAEVARAMLAAQRKAAPADQDPGLAIRLARAMAVEVKAGGSWHKCLTSDIGLGGLTTQVPAAVQVGEELMVRLSLPGKVLPMLAHARVSSMDPMRAGSHRVNLAFTKMRDDERKIFEVMIFDLVVAQLKRPR